MPCQRIVPLQQPFRFLLLETLRQEESSSSIDQQRRRGCSHPPAERIRTPGPTASLDVGAGTVPECGEEYSRICFRGMELEECY